DQPLGLALRPVGDGRAHQQILLVGGPAEEKAEGGEEGHEGGRAEAPAEDGDLAGQLLPQRRGPCPPAVAGFPRPGVIGGQAQPSETMGSAVTRRTCASALRQSWSRRSSGPADRSNARRAS